MQNDLFDLYPRKYPAWDAFTLKPDDIIVPKDVLIAIKEGKYGIFGESKARAIKTLKISLIMSPVIVFVLASVLYWLGIKWFLGVREANFYWEFIIVLTVIALIVGTVYQIRNFPTISDQIINTEIERYQKSKVERLYSEYIKTPKYNELWEKEKQRRSRNEKLLEPFDSGIKVFDFFEDYWSFICQYRWTALNEHEIFFRLENVFMNYNIEAIWDPKMTRLSNGGKILFTYFFHKKYSALSAPEVREIINISDSIELGQVIIVNMYKEPAKTAEKVLVTTNFITLTLSEFLTNVFFILHFDYYMPNFENSVGQPIIQVIQAVKNNLILALNSLIETSEGDLDIDYIDDARLRIKNRSMKIDELITKFFQPIGEEIFTTSGRNTKLVPNIRFSFQPIDRSRQYFTRNKRTRNVDDGLYEFDHDPEPSYKFRRKKY